MNKRGQAGPAAGVVAIVAFLIVIYILLLPESAREELLNQTTSTGASGTTEKQIERTILVSAHPGTLDPVKIRSRDKTLASFNLYSEKTAVVLKSVDAIHIENGWLRSKTYNLSFKVDDLEHTENYILAFDVVSSLGRAVVNLNGKEIYNAQVGIGNVEPIRLDQDLIKNQNSVLFTVSGVGLVFWRLNEYDLRNVRVIADFTDVSKKEYTNSFIISATEIENFENTELDFVPDCLTKNVGPLKIWINNRELTYKAIPDCGTLAKIPFDPGLLRQGENTITFRAEEGNYFVDRISIKSNLKALTYPFSYFGLKKSDIEAIEDDAANVTLELRFADLEPKLGEININNHIRELDTDNATYVKLINDFVEEGNNYVQITPKTILNIVDLKVVIAK